MAKAGHDFSGDPQMSRINFCRITQWGDPAETNGEDRF